MQVLLITYTVVAGLAHLSSVIGSPQIPPNTDIYFQFKSIGHASINNKLFSFPTSLFPFLTKQPAINEFFMSSFHVTVPSVLS